MKAPQVARTKPFVQEEDFIDALYKPHTVFGLVVGLAVLIYYAFVRDVDAIDEVANIKLGMLLTVAIFTIWCGVHLPDGLLVRPHPVVWRCVTALGITYLVALVFMLFQSVHTARKMVHFLDPALGTPLPERSYGDECAIYTPNHPSGSNFANVVATVSDEFIIAHVLGYWGKAVVLRSWRLVTFISIGFELVEITFQHALKNYVECWWDHIIIDIMICNAGGMWLGLWTCRWLEAKQYTWVKVKQIPTYKGRFMRVVRQFSPIAWTPYKWNIFSSFKLLGYFLFATVGILVFDNNAFFLKYILWIPPPHPINAIRLLLFLFLAIPGFRELYQFAKDPETRRLGTTAWTTICICAVELMIILKFSIRYNLFQDTPMPPHIKYPWIATLCLFALWASIYYPARKLLKRNTFLSLMTEALFLMIFVPLVFMFLAGCVDLQWGREWFERSLAEYGLH
eukprot:NODE_1084_length_1478_cov_62.596595_g1073_i0.p1 GENE.NODE_1084_length_1478_cov_62.596595_g1073_i0~~NODE_1084_length_1478_cov_62.596595_g1073_i0.p1  ORF type:complete len:473 (-),score=87.48 NODE_1084_length_1478_cov_62.596595_g1073_i0:58-1419(-)